MCARRGEKHGGDGKEERGEAMSLFPTFLLPSSPRKDSRDTELGTSQPAPLKTSCIGGIKGWLEFLYDCVAFHCF